MNQLTEYERKQIIIEIIDLLNSKNISYGECSLACIRISSVYAMKSNIYFKEFKLLIESLIDSFESEWNIENIEEL